MSESDFIYKLYRLTFPYKEPSPSPSENCKEIREVLNNLCQPMMKYLLVVIARAMDINPGQHESSRSICNELKSHLNSCKEAFSPFVQPVTLSYQMRNFLKESGLNKDAPLAVTMAVKEGISSRAILTPLFNIYAKQNNMQVYPDELNFVKSTPLMNKWFGDTYEQMIHEHPKVQHNIINPNTLKKQPRTKQPVFNPDKFRYSSFPIIFGHNITPAENNPIFDKQLNTAQQEVLAKLAEMRNQL